jgi:methionyl-tRNA formyltransferase
MRVVFLGTSRFACPTLEVVAKQHELAMVVTQPDRRAGRGRKLCAPPAKELAERLGIPTMQPEKASAPDVVEALSVLRPEILVVASFGQLLKRRLFALAPLGTINLHASLLPKYRGAAPVHWAVIHGEQETGVTTFLLDEGMDTGDLLLMERIAIGADETAGDIEPRLAVLGAELVLRTLEGLEAGSLMPVPQDDEIASYAPKLTREDGRIDWEQPAAVIHNRVRGLHPWPGAFSLLGDERLKIHRTARTGIRRGDVLPGATALRETGRFLVAAADELLELVEVQRECRPTVSGEECLRGLRGEECFSPSTASTPGDPTAPECAEG